MNATIQTREAGTILERFSQVDRRRYTQEVEKLWQSASRLKNAIAEEVQAGNLPPMTGLAITSCVAATALGYESFHGETTESDLLAALDIRSRQRARELSLS
jgi:hypothetical protein